jgi:membrane protein
LTLKKVKDWIAQTPVFQQLLEWSMTHALPGTEGIPIYDIVKFFRKELQNEDIGMRANSIAFSFFIAIFPALLFLISLLPYLPIENFIDNLKLSILSLFPIEAADFIISSIDSLTLIEREGLLSVSILMALFFSSNGMISMMRGFDKSYEISYKSRNIFQKRGTAILLTALLGTMLVSSVILIIFGRNILDALLHWAQLDQFSINAFLILRWFIIIALIYTGIALIYHLGPALKKRLKFMSAGASVATFLIILSSLGFSFFVNQFNTYNQVYGSIGALIVILLLFQINSLIILIGYELNASIAVNRDIKEYREKLKSSPPSETGDIKTS